MFSTNQPPSSRGQLSIPAYYTDSWSTGPNDVNFGRQTKPPKPLYKLLNSRPIGEGQVSETLVARQVVLGPVSTTFLSPKQLYRYKKTPIHWYFSSRITGISWNTQKTSILLHTWVRYNFLSLLYLVISLYNLDSCPYNYYHSIAFQNLFSNCFSKTKGVRPTLIQFWKYCYSLAFLQNSGLGYWHTKESWSRCTQSNS